MPFPLKIVGLNKGSEGRCCGDHDICGEIVVVGSILRVVCEVNACHGTTFTDMALYLGTCKVGFIKQELVHYAASLNGRLIQVSALNSSRTADVGRRHDSCKNYGSGVAYSYDEY